MKFITYKLSTTWGTWSAGLLVKDLLTLTFYDDLTGKTYTVETCVNYSARGYGRMVRQPHAYVLLNGRMHWKHYKYMDGVDTYRRHVVRNVLYVLIGKEFKSVNSFIKEYNKLMERRKK